MSQRPPSKKEPAYVEAAISRGARPLDEPISGLQSMLESIVVRRFKERLRRWA